MNINKSDRLFFFYIIIIGMLLTIDYHFLRNLKDTLVVTHPKMGAETIPFLKVWVLLPATILFTALYTNLSRTISQKNLFYSICTIFSSFFFVFAFYLFPNQEEVTLNKFSNFLSFYLPSSLDPLISICKYWHLSLFFIFAELWGSAVLLVLFWGMCNRSTTEDQAKSFYGPLTFFLNFAGLIANYLMMQFVFPCWDYSFQFKIYFVVGTAYLSLFIYYLFCKKFSGTVNQRSTPFSRKESMGFLNSLKYLIQTPYLLALAFIVFSYFFTFGIVEIFWQKKLRELYPEPATFSRYLNQLNMFIGIISMFTSLVITTSVLRICGWFVTALVTPLCLTICIVLFFVPQFFQSIALDMLVFFGALYIGLARIMKFSFFDISKEMSYIPLNFTAQVKAKAVIDGLMPKMGKICESFLLQSVQVVFHGFQQAGFFIFTVAILFKIGWILGIVRMHKEQKTIEIEGESLGSNNN